MGRTETGSFVFLIDLRSAEVKPGFLERKALDAEEYLASLGMTVVVNLPLRVFRLRESCYFVVGRDQQAQAIKREA